ncbi:MaoC family dehydratase [Candidatus Peregrinibacteria bacterium]|nr:MaoC family dehydratase [Candidatus Peregrinibacteria bacterium]
MKYPDIPIGFSRAKTREVSEKLIKDFAELSEDRNPLHLDEEYAQKTIFGRRIAHGMLTASFISALLAENFPGGVYLSQTLNWLRPVRIGDEITTSFLVTEKNDAKKILHLSTEWKNQKNEILLNGVAIIKLCE